MKNTNPNGIDGRIDSDPPIPAKSLNPFEKEVLSQMHPEIMAAWLNHLWLTQTAPNFAGLKRFLKTYKG